MNKTNTLGNPSHNDIENSSSDDDCTMYSGQARRYGKAKMAMFPTKVVQLIDTEEMHSVGRKRCQEITCGSDDSLDDELKPKKSKSDDEDDACKLAHSKQVETFDDLEEVDISVEVQSSIPIRETSIVLNESITVVEDDAIAVVDHSLIEPNDIDGDAFIEESQTVKVRFRSQVHRIELKKDQYFKVLMQEIALINKLGNDVKMSFYLNEKPLDPYDTLKKVPISITDIIEGYTTTETSTAATESAHLLQFKVQAQNRSSSITISIRKEDPMSVLMEKYSEHSKIELSRLRFQFDGETLQPNDTPVDLDLDGGECFDVYIK